MFINCMISTIFFTIMLAFGHIMMFVDDFSYWLIPLYVILLIVTYPCYHETCKSLDKKDFLFSGLFCVLASLIYMWNKKNVNFDILMFLYLAVFIPYVSFTSSIRYKSLI